MEEKIEFREKERVMTLEEVILAAERAKIPLRIDRPGFTRIAVDWQLPLKQLKIGVANITY